MLDRWHDLQKRIEPVLWQEITRLSSIFLFCGWISLYYHRFTSAPISYWTVWAWSSLIVISAAYFGYHVRGTYQNRALIMRTMIPGLLLLLLISLQVMRFPYDFPFFSALWQSIRTSLLENNQLPREFWHLIYLLFLVWRGLVIGRSPADSQAQQRTFLGFLIGVAAYQVVFDPHHSGILVYCSVIFLIGLIGLPAGRIVTVSMFRGGRLPHISRTWLLSILGMALLMLFSGLLASLPLNLSLAKIASSLFISMFSGLIYLIFLALSPIAYGIMLVFSKFLERILSGTQMEVPDTQTGLETINQLQQEAQETFHQSILTAQNILLILLVILLIWIIWRTLRRKPWENHKTIVMEEGEISPGQKPAWNLPISWNSIREVLNLPPARSFSSIRIRWIYANLCYYAKLLGSPRKPAATPLEYQHTLQMVFTNHNESIQQITEAYIAVRYGQLPESADEMEKIQRSWESLEKEAQTLLQERRKLRRKKNKPD